MDLRIIVTLSFLTKDHFAMLFIRSGIGTPKKRSKRDVANGSKTECIKWNTGSHGRVGQQAYKTQGAGSIRTQ